MSNCSACDRYREGGTRQGQEVNRPVMMCLRCGYLKKGRQEHTREDKAHLRRCDYTMTIRYVTKTGIRGGIRDCLNRNQ